MGTEHLMKFKEARIFYPGYNSPLLYSNRYIAIKDNMLIVVPNTVITEILSEINKERETDFEKDLFSDFGKAANAESLSFDDLLGKKDCTVYINCYAEIHF